MMPLLSLSLSHSLTHLFVLGKVPLGLLQDGIFTQETVIYIGNYYLHHLFVLGQVPLGLVQDGTRRHHSLTHILKSQCPCIFTK
jgi:hypothetical protein